MHKSVHFFLCQLLSYTDDIRSKTASCYLSFEPCVGRSVVSTQYRETDSDADVWDPGQRAIGANNVWETALRHSRSTDRAGWELT